MKAVWPWEIKVNLAETTKLHNESPEPSPSFLQSLNPLLHGPDLLFLCVFLIPFLAKVQTLYQMLHKGPNSHPPQAFCTFRSLHKICGGGGRSTLPPVFGHSAHSTFSWIHFSFSPLFLVQNTTSFPCHVPGPSVILFTLLA